jgi:hypothetical protein
LAITSSTTKHRPLCLLLVVACGGSSEVTPDAPDGPVGPTPNLARGIEATHLGFDASSMAATATITFEPGDVGATLEVGDLAIDRVTSGGAEVEIARTGDKLDLALPASAAPITVEIEFRYMHHVGFEGSNVGGFTFTWPYFCGNLFPCHSDPADGTSFSLDVTGVPEGKTAVFPPAIATEAPSYQLAWAIDDYSELSLGTTTAGTEVVMWHRPNEQATAQSGGANLVAVFDWLEQTLGPYRFGGKVGTVSVAWPQGAFGGMEHHPRWHISSRSLGSQEVNAHEAAHGWYGDGIRIACWEDFVLSEGTTTYLAGRALEVVAPEVGAAVWASYAQELAGTNAAAPVWPQSCGAVDILRDNLFTNAPYIRGAFFYRALAERLGAETIDQVLATFYAAHAGKAATMADMLATIESVTGYDPAACAETWLRQPVRPTPGPCP